MDNQKFCNKCGQPMEYVAAGFSKTKNKPYSAFWACPSKIRDHNEFADSPRQQSQPSQQPNNYANNNVQQPVRRPMAQDPQVTQALKTEEDKQLRIARESALSTVSQITVPQQDPVAATADLIEAADILVGYIYNGKVGADPAYPNQEIVTEEEMDNLPF